MKLLVLLVFCLVAVSLAVPLPKQYYYPDNVQLLKYENNNIGTTGHKYSFEQSDGTQQEQEGELRNEGSDDELYAVKGSYSWIGPDGVKYTVNYVADENGYQPELQQGPGGVIPYDVLSSSLG